ncbi:phage portal protein [Chromobacterium vaccinii]|uniref:phage portal protein n=1 Tax=Chromobacterium vaccinii TaxID=1108595 RepID=UPI001E5E59BD|nr:phage portal protein [Chromobacterium vaccinii]MCD4483409.1 phage portal protein [Chromobacterium vaccinii]
MFMSQQFGQSAASPDPGWLSSLLGGGARSAAGVAVSPDKALSITTYQACITTLAESLAQLPCELYRRNGDQRERVTDHPVAQLLRQPNGWQTPFEYAEGAQIAAAHDGNAYSYIERDEAGRPVALLPMEAGKVAVLRGADLMPYYQFNGQEPMPARMVHHVRWFTRNGYTGISPVQLHCDSLGLALATHGHASAVFANGTHLAGVLERPAVIGGQDVKPLSAERVLQIKAAWKREYAGRDNAMKVALLQEGITFKPLSMTNADAQLIDARKLSALEVAQIFKMPPHKVGLLDRATNNNIEHQGIEYVIYCLMPWIKRHEQARMRDLLLPSERGELYIEFNVSGLLRGDTQSRYAAYAIGRQWGWLSANDIRRLENLPPIPGGDVYMQPLNMVDTRGASLQVKSDTKALAEIEGILKR